MGARFGTCHDTCLRLASAGYLRYAPRVGLWLRHTASLPVAICDGTETRGPHVSVPSQIRARIYMAKSPQIRMKP